MMIPHAERSPRREDAPLRPGPSAARPRPPRRRTTALASGAALVLALGAVGCGGDDEPTASTAAATGGQGAGTSTTPATDTASTTAAQAPAQPDGGTPIATRSGDVDGDAVTMELLGLKRSGPTVVANLRLRLTTPDPEGNARAQIAQRLANDVYEKTPSGASIGGDNADGIELIDTKNRKRHLVARDSENRCVCSTGLSSTFVRAAAPINLSATFGAPPADVGAMDVTIPGFGTLTDVPLS